MRNILLVVDQFNSSELIVLAVYVTMGYGMAKRHSSDTLTP
jgi:hypothetical protein